jgi:hypothetical protein
VQLGLTLKQSSAVHIQALVSADVILPGSSSKLRLLVINLASVPGGQLVNSPTAQSLERYEQKNQNFDEALLLGEKIHNKFVEIVISHAQKLHKEGVIASKFGKVIPIIIHELEYYDKPVSWTRQANPSGLTREFENWVAQF